jgi:hypothetical protein
MTVIRALIIHQPTKKRRKANKQQTRFDEERREKKIVPIH